jgi:DNA-binding transcriptional regulator YdaS (Cro superfamily)
MILKDWLKKEKIRPGTFAKSMGVDTSLVYRHLSGERKFSAKTAVKVEKATKGQVSRSEAVWPEDYMEKEYNQMTMFEVIERNYD